jgi:uncharacterized protein with FMN-binding domain
MKRAPWYLVGAVAGFASVLALHSRATPAPSALGAAGKSEQPSQSAQPARSSTGPAAGGSPGSQPAGAAGGTHNATGALERYGYGELAVRVTVSRNRITNVTVPALQTADPTSQQIADQAIPMLRSEVLAADSASINGVSGATFTSEAYATSLQAALDKLHLR